MKILELLLAVLGPSWKTSGSGYALLIGGISLIVKNLMGDGLTYDELYGAVSSIVGGVGLIMARDKGVSTEQQQGTKP